MIFRQVHANGEVHLWKFKRPGYVWKQQGMFMLLYIF